MNGLIDTSKDDYADVEDLTFEMQGIIVKRTMKRLFKEFIEDDEFFETLNLEPRKYCVKVSIRIQWGKSKWV